MHFKENGQIGKFIKTFSPRHQRLPTNICDLGKRLAFALMGACFIYTVGIFLILSPLMVAIMYFANDVNFSTMMNLVEQEDTILAIIFATTIIEMVLVVTFSIVYVVVERKKIIGACFGEKYARKMEIKPPSRLVSNIKEMWAGFKDKFCPTIDWD